MNKSSEVDGEAKDIVQCIRKAEIPAEEKSFARILAECRSVVLAGQETTATILTTVTFHLLSDASKLAKLQSELKDAQDAKGSKLQYADLRNLPYLSAVIDGPCAPATPSLGDYLATLRWQI